MALIGINPTEYKPGKRSALDSIALGVDVAAKIIGAGAAGVGAYSELFGPKSKLYESEIAKNNATADIEKLKRDTDIDKDLKIKNEFDKATEPYTDLRRTVQNAQKIVSAGVQNPIEDFTMLNDYVSYLTRGKRNPQGMQMSVEEYIQSAGGMLQQFYNKLRGAGGSLDNRERLNLLRVMERTYNTERDNYDTSVGIYKDFAQRAGLKQQPFNELKKLTLLTSDLEKDFKRNTQKTPASNQNSSQMPKPQGVDWNLLDNELGR